MPCREPIVSLTRLYCQVLYMTGWAPHPSQQRPSRRGSATVSLEQLQEALEAKKGEPGGAAGA